MGYALTANYKWFFYLHIHSFLNTHIHLNSKRPKNYHFSKTPQTLYLPHLSTLPSHTNTQTQLLHFSLIATTSATHTHTYSTHTLLHRDAQLCTHTQSLLLPQHSQIVQISLPQAANLVVPVSPILVIKGGIKVISQKGKLCGSLFFF